MRLLGVVAVLAAGCAASRGYLTGSVVDRVHVASVPAGADVRVEGIFIGQTPTWVAVPRDGDGIVHVDLAGYRPRAIRLKKINGDRWVTDPISLQLEPDGAIVPAAAPAKKICAYRDPYVERLRPAGYVSPDEEGCTPAQ